MDECEALCHRIGIMVAGRLRCLGNAQHLKNKYGQGYQLDVNTDSKHAEDLLNGIAKLFPNSKLLERHDGVMKFQLLPADGVSQNLADVFELIEKSKEQLHIGEYSVSQTSLEQIFINFAKQQDEEKTDAPPADKEPLKTITAV
jgi:ABC-type multidrug transport system ATPase subunit